MAASGSSRWMATVTALGPGRTGLIVTVAGVACSAASLTDCTARST